MNNAQTNATILQTQSDSKKKNRKTDRRTLYTRRVIMDSYIDLLKEKPRDKIKVAEICRLAEINRCTFYLHFEDIVAVESAIEKELADKFSMFLKTQSKDNTKRQIQSGEFMNTLLHDETYVTLMTSNRPSLPLSTLMEEFYISAMKPALSVKNFLSERQQKLLYTFIVGGIVAIEQDWIKNNCVEIEQENMFLDKIVQLLISNIT